MRMSKEKKMEYLISKCKKHSFKRVVESLIKKTGINDFETSGQRKYSKKDTYFLTVENVEEYQVVRTYMIRCFNPKKVNRDMVVREVKRTITSKTESLEFYNNRFFVMYTYRYYYRDEAKNWTLKNHFSYYSDYLDCSKILIDKESNAFYCKGAFNKIIEAYDETFSVDCLVALFQHPKYELCFKMDYFKKISRIEELSNKQLMYICKNHLDNNEIDNLIALGEYGLDYHKISGQARETIALLTPYFDNAKTRLIRFIKSYLVSNEQIDLTIFNDYLDQLKELNIALTKDNVFIKNYASEHDRLSVRINLMKNSAKCKNANKKYLKVVDKFLPLEYHDNEYSIIVPKNVEAFLQEATMQSNCVFANKYYERMSNGKCIILFMRKNNDLEHSFVTIELDMDFKVRQCYGKHNSNPGDDIRNYVSNLALQYKQKNILQLQA